ncbi:MAG: OB-fold domain-containing protein [Acidimicrobiia bacterium]|nr:OB-fold domain-containing protein [Acidimicrobiia bacterium]
MSDTVGADVPVVDYLVLGDGDPHLVATACSDCGALWFGRRSGCGRCGSREFRPQRLATTGTVRTFTIVARAPKGVPAPYVSAVVDLEGGGHVKATVVGVEADPSRIELGMPVRLTTFEAGRDDNGTTAVAFGFEPTS